MQTLQKPSYESLAANFHHWQKTGDLIDQCIDLMLNLRQSGHPGGSRTKVPRLVAGLASVEAVRVVCGGHTCVLGAHGELFTFGNGKHGQLGHKQTRDQLRPRRIRTRRRPKR